MTKTHWTALADKLWDSDGCNPDEEQLVACMREFRADGCISDYYFVDIRHDCVNPDEQPELYRDSWNNDELREAWECGPLPSAIDFAGLDEAKPEA